MRIAMVHPSLWGRGGAERQLLRLAVELQKLGHEPEIFTDVANPQCYPELLRQVTVNVVPHPLHRLHEAMDFEATSSMVGQKPGGKQNAPFLDKALRKMVLNQYYTKELPMMLNIGRNIPKGFDVINNHNFPSEWAALVAKRRLKAPVVWMCNGPASWFLNKSKGKLGGFYYPLFEFFDRASVDYIDRIVTLSDALAKDVWTAYGRKASIVHTGVDAGFFHKADGASFRRNRGLTDNFVLLQVGNIGQVRRNIDSVNILQYLAKNYANVRLVLDGFGAPVQIENLKSIARKHGVEDKLIIQHSKTDVELAQVYAGCDVFIYPSHTPWSLAVTEAMAASRPAIIPKQCGVAEVVENGKTAIVIDKPTPQEAAKEIALQIEKLLQNPDLACHIGQNAYDFVKRNLSWEQYAKGMVANFESAINQPKKL